MSDNILDNKAVILENPSQMRRCIKRCYECGMLHRKAPSQDLTYPCYMMVTFLGDNNYMIELNKDGCNSNESVLEKGYCPITINQFKDITKEIFNV